jgi:hypothetical protein
VYVYKLIQRKPAIVPALSLLFICADVEAKNKVTISEETRNWSTQSKPPT